MTSGAAVALGLFLGLLASAVKIFFSERYFFKKPGALNVAPVLIIRGVLDIGVLYAMHFQLPAMVAAAIGLTVDPIYFITYIWRKKG